MGEILFKAWLMVALIPYWIAKEAYEIFNKFMKKRGYHIHWTYFWLGILVIVLIVLLVLQYGYTTTTPV